MKLGLAGAGSGFNLGFYDGIQRALKAARVAVDAYLLTSGAALIWSMWAQGKEDILHAYLYDIEHPGDIYEGSILEALLHGRNYVYRWPTLRALLDEHIKTRDFQKPCYFGVVNETTGQWDPVYHKHPRAPRIVEASCAVKPWVEAVQVGRHRCIDGGHAYPLGDLEEFVYMEGLTHLIVCDATRGRLTHPRYEESNLLGEAMRAVSLQFHFNHEMNRRQIRYLEAQGVKTLLIEPAHHLGGGMDVKPGEMMREAEHGEAIARVLIEETDWLQEMIA